MSCRLYIKTHPVSAITATISHLDYGGLLIICPISTLAHLHSSLKNSSQSDLVKTKILSLLHSISRANYTFHQVAWTRPGGPVFPVSHSIYPQRCQHLNGKFCYNSLRPFRCLLSVSQRRLGMTSRPRSTWPLFSDLKSYNFPCSLHRNQEGLFVLQTHKGLSPLSGPVYLLFTVLACCAPGSPASSLPGSGSYSSVTFSVRPSLTTLLRTLFPLLPSTPCPLDGFRFLS